MNNNQRIHMLLERLQAGSRVTLARPALKHERQCDNADREGHHAA